jgi:hypothetical protein
VIKLPVISPVLYVTALVLSVVGTYVYKLRTEGIFACTADGYHASPDAYLGYCNAAAYGDYDHGAFWFGLEPEARRFAADADVLFLGSSRMEFAFSTTTTDSWFTSAAAHDYLMGFTFENAAFATPLLARVQPRAKVYVINVDRFFDDQPTRDSADILNGDYDVKTRYSEKQLWQDLHRSLCTRLQSACGNQFAYFRSRETGFWETRGTHKADSSLVADGPSSDQDHWNHYETLAAQFIAALPVDRSCVVLTVVPYPATKHAEARAIAGAIGLDLVDPQLDGLRTFDGSHLDRPSAERWSRAFFDSAGPRIRRCLGQGATLTAAAG